MPISEGVHLPNELEVHKSVLRLPELWIENPSLYFSQVEANFKLSNIILESTEFCGLVTSIDQQITQEIADLIRNPDSEKSYTVVKKRLIQEFEMSESKRIINLLEYLSLDDSKPSTLLRRIREFAGTYFSNKVLKSFWLSHFPSSGKSISSVSNEVLAVLVGLAVKVYEVTIFSQNCNEVPESNTLNDQISHLANEVADLKSEIETLRRDRNSRLLHDR